MTAKLINTDDIHIVWNGGRRNGKTLIAEAVTKILEEIIEKTPAVDAEPVIRCKDCRYFERRSIYCHGLCDVHCNGIGDREVTSEVDFCSWAERKKE